MPAVATLLLAAGCAWHRSKIEPCEVAIPQSQPETSVPESQPEAAPPPALSLTMTIGQSVEGRPIECRVLGHGQDVTLLVAGLHGDERGGSPLLRRLGDYLADHPELLDGRQVILVPVVNPDGLARGTRYNARGVDLNRNFPAGNWTHRVHSGERPLSEPEAQALDDLLHRYQPDRVASIHEGLACVDYDGPAAPLAQAMSEKGDLPVRKIGGLPGSLGSYAGTTLVRPIVTLELRRFANRLGEDELWTRYHEMLLVTVEFTQRTLAHAGD